MFGEKALQLIKEIQQLQSSNSTILIHPFNDECLRQVLEEMRVLFEQNQKDVESTVAGQSGMVSGIQLRHSCLQRNRRCLLAYLYGRLEVMRQMRWQFCGSVLSPDIKENLNEHELSWYRDYSRTLAQYMARIGNGRGLDLTRDTAPPKSLFIHVRCADDYGEFETSDGQIILLKKNTQHYIQRSECEHLIRQGVLEHIVS